MGFNAATEQYEDLIVAGVIDPAKVTRTALQNAASVSGMLLTTECVIADAPEEAGAVVVAECLQEWAVWVEWAEWAE